MAGIGWKLQRLIDRGSLAGTIGAYLTGVAVTSAPWLLTTAVLTSLRIVARRSGTDFEIVERFLTVVYAVTVILSAPVHVVVSRYTADRLYDHHVEKIGAPLRRATTLTLIGFALAGVVLVVAMRLPLAMAVVGAPLCAIIGAQWLMLSVGGGMTSPIIVLRAFGLGAPLGLCAAWMLDVTFGLGPAGYLYGFAAGQLATLAVLVHGVARAIPGQADEAARLAPAFREYRLLAFSALASYVSIWADKIVVYLVMGGNAAAFYAAISAVAWFSVIPAFAWIYVQVETVFYQRYRAFYGALEGGGNLASLRERAEMVRVEAVRILRGAAFVQGSVTLVALMAGPLVLRAAGLTSAALPMYLLALIGAALQLGTLLTLLLLYYFDLRRDALTVAVVLLVGEVTFTVVCWRAGFPLGLGYALGAAASCVLGVCLVHRRLKTLLLDTFQSQPYGAM